MMLGLGLGINQYQNAGLIPSIAGVIDLSQIDTRAFDDPTGLTPAVVAGGVGALRDLSGNIVGTSTGTARPFLAERPEGGLRNLANGAADPAGPLWPQTWVVGGCTWERVGTGVEDGLPYIDYRISGTPTATYVWLNRDASQTPAAVEGQRWTFSYIARRIAGGTGGHLGIAHGIDPYNGAANLGNGNWVVLENREFTNSATDTLLSTSMTNPANTTLVLGRIWLRGVVGQPIDVTYRIKGVQLEQSPTRTAWQANFNQFRTTEEGKRSVFALREDALDDVFNVAIPATLTNATVAWANELGVSISTGVTIPAGNFNALSLVGRELFGAVIAPRALTAGETASLTAYLQAKRGAGVSTPARAFTPVDTFLSGAQGAVYSPSNIATLFQDIAGTIPVTAAGQPVGRILDISGRGNHMVAGSDVSRGVYRVINSPSGRPFHCVEFDGLDDFYQIAAFAPNSAAVQVWAGVESLSNASAGVLLESSANSGTNNGTIGIFAPATGGQDNFSFRSRGTVATLPITPSAYPVGTGYTLECVGNISASLASIAVNGQPPTTVTTSQGTGGYGTHTIFVGRRGGTTVPFRGRIGEMMIRFGPALSVADTAQLAAYFQEKTGWV